MSCCHPMKAFYTGVHTESGKCDFIIMPNTAGNLLNVKEAIKRSKTHRIGPSAPMTYVNGQLYLCDPLAIPCGKCVGCRMDAAKRWKVRVCHEFEGAKPEDLHFVTLTYDNEHLPVNKYGQPVLKPEDLKAFIKRLEKPFIKQHDFTRVKCTYFACGEYGEQFARPHFHIVMRYPLRDLIPYEWQCYHSALVDDCWNHKGLTQVKPVETNMIAYVCGYCEKKQSDPYFDFYPVKPFTSKSKGLGFKYVHRLDGARDRNVYGNFGSCRTSAIPRAYLRKCEDEPWFGAYKERSLQLARQSLETNQAVYKTTDEELIGMLLEQSLLESLEELRKEKLL